MVSSFRSRLIATVIALVAATAVFTGVVAYLLVRDTLRSQLVDDAVARAEFNIGLVASDEQLPVGVDRDEFEASGVAEPAKLAAYGQPYEELWHEVLGRTGSWFAWFSQDRFGF